MRPYELKKCIIMKKKKKRNGELGVVLVRKKVAKWWWKRDLEIGGLGTFTLSFRQLGLPFGAAHV